MKTKILYITAISAIVGGAANAATAQTAYRNIYTSNDVMVTEKMAERDVDRFYAGARFDYTLANFTNTYSLASNPSDSEDDSFSFKTMLGFDATAGYHFSDKWRGELNYSYTGKFEDKDAGTTFDISAHIFTVNGIYTVREWTETSLFAGLGVGAGYLTTKFTGPGVFNFNAETSKSSLTFAGNVQLGLEQKISDDIRLVLSYKLGYMTGHKQEMSLLGGDALVSDNGGVLTNSFGIGLRLLF